MMVDQKRMRLQIQGIQRQQYTQASQQFYAPIPMTAPPPWARGMAILPQDWENCSLYKFSTISIHTPCMKIEEVELECDLVSLFLELYMSRGEREGGPVSANSGRTRKSRL